MANVNLPNGDTQTLLYVQNLSAKLVENPEKYGILAAAANRYATLVGDYGMKLAIARDEATRTRGAIAAKQAAKKLVRDDTSRLVSIIRGQNLTSQELFDIGLRPRKATLQVQDVPTSTAIVSAKMVGPRLVNVVLRDGLTQRRALPKGVKGASIFAASGDAPPADAKDWTFLGSVTRTTCKLDVSQQLGDAAGTIWLCAFYFNGKAQSGVASEPVAVDLPANRQRPTGANVQTTTMRVAA